MLSISTPVLEQFLELLSVIVKTTHPTCSCVAELLLLAAGPKLMESCQMHSSNTVLFCEEVCKLTKLVTE